MQKWLRIVLGFTLLSSIVLGGTFWFQTQPVWPLGSQKTSISPEILAQLPSTNQKILQVIENKGQIIAPTYEAAVCTEFVIQVIEEITPLTPTEKKAIRIITPLKLDSLVESDAFIIRGVQNAFGGSSKGIPINNPADVLPGDLVQFWNIFRGQAYGHCGIVKNINPGKTITLHSSHPITHGFGTQQFLWPEKVYFVRVR